MCSDRNDIIAEFTKEITKLNIGLKQYLQCKLRKNNIDLTFEMLQVLACLWKGDGVNQQELANTTVKDKASMTYLIDNLVKRDLVHRQEDSADRRNKLIFLTTRGRSFEQVIQPLIYEMYATAGQDVQLDGFSGVLAELKRMRKNIRIME
jgi:DNA-binding MarR family transcriptional regulator